jgi:hypothetical protein
VRGVRGRGGADRLEDPEVIRALLAAAAVLIAVELILATVHAPVRVARPCAERALFRGHGLDAATQRIVLDGLGRAACRLGVTREELVLSLAPQTGTRLHRSPQQVARALRSGLERALDASRDRGEIPGPLAFVLRELVRHAPLDRLVRGQLL